MDEPPYPSAPAPPRRPRSAPALPDGEVPGRAGAEFPGHAVSLPDVAVAAVVWIVVSSALFLVLAGAGAVDEDGAVTGDALLAVLLVSAAGWLAGSAAVAFRNRSAGRPAAVLGFRPAAAKWVWVAVGAAVGIRVATIVVLVVASLFGYEAENPQTDVLDGFAQAGFFAAVVLTAVGALLVPLAEETFFRGVCYAGLRRRFGRVGAAGLSAALFGFAHGVNVVFPAAFVVGLAAAWLYERSRSLWPAVALHAVFNATAFAMLFAVSALGVV